MKRNPDRLCEICATPFHPWDKTSRFCSLSCHNRARDHKTGPESPNWKGGIAKHPMRYGWKGMISRCYSPTNARYKDYGGRGITVCDQWRENFWNYVADMGPKPDAVQRWSVDRVDNDGPYSPENCRWATPSQQNYNRRPKQPRVRDIAHWRGKLGYIEQCEVVAAVGTGVRRVDVAIDFGISRRCVDDIVKGVRMCPAPQSLR